MADRAQTTPSLPGQVVLVFQGGGALGAYQGGVYQALNEAGIEPNWVIGTSIGAINGAIIAGNEPGKRLSQISKFWDRMERKPIWDQGPLALIGGNVAAQMMTIFSGIAGYFMPNRDLAWVCTPQSASNEQGSIPLKPCTRRSTASSTSHGSIPDSRG